MLFNVLASQRNLAWRADSRGLALGASNVGPIYPRVLDHLKELGYLAEPEPRLPARLEMVDLEAADLVIALNESEHRPLMLQRFEQWADQIQYWDVPDLHFMKAEEAFSRIEMRTASLVQQLLEEQSLSKPDLAGP